MYIVNILKNIGWGVFNYTILKYVEVILYGITMYKLADKIGPTEMGISVSYFLFFTYASYASFGLQQLIVTQYPTLNFEKKESLLKDAIHFNIVQSIFFWSLPLWLFKLDYAIPSIIIMISIMWRNLIQAVFRVQDKVYLLNLSNIIYAIILLVGVYLLVGNWLGYLFVWAFAVSTSAIILYSFEYKMFNNIIYCIFKNPIDLKYYKIAQKSGKLMLTTLFITFLLTIDRIVIDNMIYVSIEQKGVYQFADNIGMAFLIFISSITFYYTPEIIKKMNDDPKFILKIRKYTYFLILIGAKFSIVSYIIVKYLQFEIGLLQEYVDLYQYIPVILILKNCRFSCRY
jgi:O-antigen/teichoic acid export membrane protein